MARKQKRKRNAVSSTKLFKITLNILYGSSNVFKLDIFLLKNCFVELYASECKFLCKKAILYKDSNFA